MQLASRLMSKESSTAIKSIRKILTNVEAHGVVDSFSRFPNPEVWASVYALSRLQRAARLHDRRHQKQSFPVVHNRELLRNLAHYAVYANVAYGWKMDLAFRRRLHLGGDIQALLRRTGIPLEDVIAAEWESRTHRPGYFIVRDRAKKKIVLCVRGTFGPHDLLTALCCTARDFDIPLKDWATTDKVADLAHNHTESSVDKQSSRPLRAHHGMLEAARGLLVDAEPLLEKELQANPDFGLVLVGHSLGGGAAFLLGMLLGNKFPELVVYVYGAPCVAPIESRPTQGVKVFSVVNEGDPFACLSLGHVADVSAGLSHLCLNPELRSNILIRTNGNIDEMESGDLKWCSQTMEALRGRRMTAEKLYPPANVLFLSNESNLLRLLHVPPDHFQDLIISPRMFDLARHIPSLYESRLQSLLAQ